ncbi:hypothetical protein BCR34DRAFT_233292 [Clohesyomyces aquaticus]|uniref:Uncharacterized protein n=1 Tax=Clohesyomyces aquaticus TaxID=1231657 RepID=A0A1Y1ZW16_9PLEO|nr:hypothetical protein BCR34DRAFT_233292 [Clohesyomyces aquaticus]
MMQSAQCWERQAERAGQAISACGVVALGGKVTQGLLLHTSRVHDEQTVDSTPSSCNCVNCGPICSTWPAAGRRCTLHSHSHSHSALVLRPLYLSPGRQPHVPHHSIIRYRLVAETGSTASEHPSQPSGTTVHDGALHADDRQRPFQLKITCAPGPSLESK